ncbi:MAG: DUF4438 domain-containing protein [Desulforhopalus sp.]|nr:DUF4438 domain-containing protein [Desulforhopalus sp.]
MKTNQVGAPRMNEKDLVMVTVMGQIAHPIGRPNPYRIGYDGVPRILPGTGGIAINQRVGNRCVGLAGDHIEPGVSLHNNNREIVGDKNGPNLALLTYCCVGNIAQVVTGPCAGKQGVVTGKHGGIEHLLIDFPTDVLRRLRIGDRVQIFSFGLGLHLPDHPRIQAMNCSPRLIRRWGVRADKQCLHVPVTHLVPAKVMGSGIGQNNAIRGDYDIQLFDPKTTRRFNLDTLRFGDFVAIIHSDSRFGRAFRHNAITIAVVVHGDSTISGHGPGAMALLTGDRRCLIPIRDRNANLAQVLRIRQLPPLRQFTPLIKLS